MIADFESNIVYFSDLLREDEFSATCEKICNILDKHNVKYDFLKGTKAIWARDYMPIQVEQDKFVQFKYEPSYLEKDLNSQSEPKCVNSQSEPKHVLQTNGISAKFSDINLDGGNVIKWTDKVILTKRVFKENPNTDKNKLIRELERLFSTKLFFVPDITEDMTGHTDGHLRFIDSKTILVNELQNELKYWKTDFQEMVKQAKLDFVEIPWFEHKDKNHKETAVGGYVNYLEIDKLILFPIFEIEGNKDKEAIAVIKKVFPDKIIEPINVNEIAKYGGLMNCITWNIKI